MEGQKAAGSVFMCRLCNIFSPCRSQLLAHCSNLHPQQEPPDDIIIALQPLVGEPAETHIESPVKRKRGRPKGSKNIRSVLKEGKADSTHSTEENVQREEVETKKEGDGECSPKEGESHDGISGLKCGNCHRSFSNRRQILKHICLREEEEEEDRADNGSQSGQASVEGSESLDTGGENPNKKQQNSLRPGTKRKRDTQNSRPLGASQSRNSKEGGPAKGMKKSVISVFLTEDETLPGVTKMVPVEESSAETDSAANQARPQASAVFQKLSKDLPREAAGCEGNPKTDQDTSSNTNPTTTTTTTTTSRCFQEYSIKQNAHNLHQSKLKIYSCEFCNKIFKFRHTLMSHLRTHTQEKPFQCPHCDYASAIKGNLNVHLRKHTGEKFSCPHCPFTCLSQGHLKVHIERVHLKVKQHCSFCQSKYSDVKNLLKHMEERHNLKDPAVQQSYQTFRLKTRQVLRQLLYYCPTCNRRFKNKLEQERHLLVHGPLRPFACLLCDHAATKMSALAAHVRKHLFLYVCCVCDRKFVSSLTLKSHLEETHPELDQEATFGDCIKNSYCLTQPGGDMWGNEEREDTEEGKVNECRLEQEVEERGTREEGRGKGVGEEEWKEGEEKRTGVAVGENKEQKKEEEQATSQGQSVEEKQVIEETKGRNRGLENESAQQELQVVSMETRTSTDGRDEVTVRGESQDDMVDSCTPAAEHNTHSVLPAESTQNTLLEGRTQEITHSAEEITNTSSSSGNTCLLDLRVHTPLSSAPQGGDAQTSNSERVSEVPHESAFQQVLSSIQKTRLNIESFQRLRKIYGELECQYCGKLFMYNVHHNVHIRTHTKEHLHYCSKCSYSTITKSALMRHQIQKHSGMQLACSSPDCTYTTPDKYKLQAHMKTHKGKKKSVSCPVCQQSYPEHRLKHHIKTSHPESLPAQGIGLMVQRAEKCPYCDSYFVKNSSDFQRHIWEHQGVKPYVCSVCDYASRSSSNLRAHMNRHNTERSHLCDLCGKKFKSKITLRSHRLSHNDEGKQFQCSQCDYTSASKRYLLRHMEQHAEYKPFRCAHCHYSCNIARPLKRHYKLKHPDRKYENAGPGLLDSDTLKQQGGMKCPECEYVYGTKWELNRHMRSKHSLKVVEGTWEVGEAVETQYVTVENEEQLTEIPVDALQENVDIQQITEFSSETHDAVTSMVAMAPGTVTVVQQLQVADEQEVGDCSNQLMVVNADGGLTGDQVMVVNTDGGLTGDQVMVVDADGDVTGDQVMVVEDAHGLEALTVLTQGENTHHYIVYVQEHTVEIN
ncbi:zinc finger protein ZFAT [Tautogolabrus adspersus]